MTAGGPGTAIGGAAKCLLLLRKECSYLLPCCSPWSLAPPIVGARTNWNGWMHAWHPFFPVSRRPDRLDLLRNVSIPDAFWVKGLSLRAPNRSVLPVTDPFLWGFTSSFLSSFFPGLLWSCFLLCLSPFLSPLATALHVRNSCASEHVSHVEPAMCWFVPRVLRVLRVLRVPRILRVLCVLPSHPSRPLRPSRLAFSASLSSSACACAASSAPSVLPLASPAHVSFVSSASGTICASSSSALMLRFSNTWTLWPEAPAVVVHKPSGARTAALHFQHMAFKSPGGPSS